MRHDIMRVGAASVTCRCGREFTEATLAKAREAHEHHFGLEEARASLKRGSHLTLVVTSPRTRTTVATDQEATAVPEEEVGPREQP